jgi:flagellar basal body-associated protein FliL
MAKKAKAGDDAAEKKSPKKKIIIGVVALAAGWKLGFIPIAQPKEDAGAVGTTTTTAVVEGDTVEVGDEAIVVNLADTDVAHYARVAVALVLNEHPSEASDDEHAAAEADAHAETPATEAPHIETPATDAGVAETTPTDAAHVETASTEAAHVETASTEAAAHKGAAVGKVASGGGGAEVDPIAAVEGRFPAVQNLVIVELRTWTYAQLLAPDALQVLQARLTEQVQEIYEHDEVVRVVFTQFVVQ